MKRLLQPVCMLAAACLLSFSAVAADTSFEKDIRPIFEKKCAGCHFPDLGAVKAKLDLSSAPSVLTGGKSGEAVAPGKPNDSLIVQRVERTDDDRMPPEGKGSPLTPEEVNVLRQWITDGAKSSGEPIITAPSAEQTAARDSATSAIPASVSALAFSPDPATPLIAKGGLHTVTLYSATPDKAFLEPVCTLTGHAEMVRALAFSPNGKTLAAAGGKPSRSGEVKLWNVADRSLIKALEGHKDNILDVAFSPDGKRLATASYDKTIILWDIETGSQIRTLAQHVDAVYAVAFSPDGKQLATGAGDRTVKIWNAETGEMIVTMSDSLDSVLTLAFSPSGKHLAGAGADKIIRIWDAGDSTGVFQQTGTSGGVLVKSTFAHGGAVLRIAYSPDGATIYSASEDKRVKAWDANSLAEKLTFEPQSDWVTALAIDKSGKLLVAGRYDSTASLYAADTGKPLSGANPAGEKVVVAENTDASSQRKKITSLDVEAVVIRATVPPSVQQFFPERWTPGTEAEVVVSGKNLDQAHPVLFSPHVTAQIIESTPGPEPEAKLPPGMRGTGADIFDNARPYTLKLKLKVAPDAPVGRYDMLFQTPIGMTNGVAFLVIEKLELGEAEPNDELATAQRIDWPSVVVGKTNTSGDVDAYRISVKAGQELVASVRDSGINTQLRLLDSNGAQLYATDEKGDRTKNEMGYRFESDGEYILEIADRELRPEIGYRIHLGAFPLVTEVWPLGVSSGAPQKVAVKGYNIAQSELEIDPPDTAAHDTTIPLPVASVGNSPLSPRMVAVSPFPETFESEPNNESATAQNLSSPATVNGRISGDNGVDSDLFRISAGKDQLVVIEVMAARLGSPLDSIVEVQDANGALLERGVVRCVAETFMTLSGRDSVSAGLRLDAWREIAVNDFVMVGSEIIRVSKLPGYADEDVVFKAYASGQRIAYLGTTPEQHAVYTKAYKVEVQPVGAQLAPNGLPTFPLYWRNDDGFFGAGEAGGDSYLEFIAPADGEYLVRVSDAIGRSGDAYAYRLMLRSLTPDFVLTMAPYRVNVSRESRIPIDVRAVRRDGFDGPISVRVEGLPSGYSCEPDVILAGEDLVRLALVARSDAQSTANDAAFKIVGESEIGGVSVLRETALGPITINERRPDLVVKNGQTAVAIPPGKSGYVSVHLDRFNDFTSRSPIAVLNLPFGVRVMDTGLNGILVREGEFDRRMELYVEPWVKPMKRSIYIQALIETQSPTKPTFVGEPITLEIPCDVAVASN